MHACATAACTVGMILLLSAGVQQFQARRSEEGRQATLMSRELPHSVVPRDMTISLERPLPVTDESAQRVRTDAADTSREVERREASAHSIPSAETPKPTAPETMPMPEHEAAPVVSSSSSSSFSSSSPSSSSSSPLLSPSTPTEETLPPQDSGEEFPAFGFTLHPVAQVPNWGAMRTPAEWERSYKDMRDEDFVSIPRYDLSVLTRPMSELTKPLRPENFPLITAKLYYSTRFFGAYDIDAGEFTGTHAGIDLKLARGTPVGAIAGGRVASVGRREHLGLTVIIEHRLPDGSTVYSVYGHFDSVAVEEGESVTPGMYIGNVGMTGSTTAPHLHLQIDRGEAGGTHVPHRFDAVPSPNEAEQQVLHPIRFLAQYARR